VINPERLHNLANKNTVIIPDGKKLHHKPIPRDSVDIDSPVTASGVSAANVVATIRRSASHHDTFLPETK